MELLLASLLAATMSACSAKLWASLVMFVSTLACGYLPMMLVMDPKYVQHALFAGGGVLMATAFCHLMPEAHDGYMSKMPYTEITLCCGFFFLYTFEQVMSRFIGGNHSHQGGVTHAKSEGEAATQSQEVIGARKTDADETSVIIESVHELPTTSGLGQSQTPAVQVDAKRANTANNTGNEQEPSGASKTSEFYRFVRGFMLVAAFGTHLLFDGVAIGSQETSEDVWTLFAAISCHKLIIAAVIGFELYAATLQSHRWALLNLIIFSILSPIGTIIVVIAQDAFSISSDAPSMILLQSFATGTLLYIIFVEILQTKLQGSESHRIGRVISLILGFAFMLAALTLIGHHGK